MFCPRCGSQNPDTTKFCRQCGLGLQPVTGYVASGGTSSLQPPSRSGDVISKAVDGLTPKQQMILLIMMFAMSPAILGTLGLGRLSGISAVLIPIGIVFAVMRYKAQERRWKEMMKAQQQQMPPATPYELPQAVQQPVPQTRPQQPVYQQPSSPPTNPLGPNSVTEDETRRLPGQ